MMPGSSLWLEQRGQRLGQVIKLNNRLSVDGTLHLTTCTGMLDSFVDTTGQLDICDDTGMVYCAQALDFWCDYDTVTLACSTLGHVNEEHETQHDDDYLVVDGYGPVTVKAFAQAHSGCKRGQHIRLELPAASWSALDVRCGVDEQACVPDAGAAHRETDSENHWNFRVVRLEADGGAAPFEADLVRLRQRRVARVEIDMAMVTAATVVAIGHVLNGNTWPAPSSHATGQA